jgi:hypothetical protein
MSILSSIGKIATNALNTLTVAFVHPVKTAVAVVSPKSTVKDVIEEHFNQPLSKQLTETVVRTGEYAAATLTLGTSTGIKALTSVGNSLVPKTVLGKVAGVTAVSLAAPAIAGVVVAHPEKAAVIVENAPVAFVEAQRDIYKLAKEPSIEEAQRFLREHPYLTASTAAAALIGIGYGGIKMMQLIETHYNTKALQENSEKPIQITDYRGKDEKLTSIPSPTTPQAINIYTAPPPVATPVQDASVPGTATSTQPVVTQKKKKKKVTAKKKKPGSRAKIKKKVTKKKKKAKKKSIKRRKHK